MENWSRGDKTQVRFSRTGLGLAKWGLDIFIERGGEFPEMGFGKSGRGRSRGRGRGRGRE